MPARHLSLRKRFMAITSNERQKFRQLLKGFIHVGLRVQNHRLSEQCRIQGQNFCLLLLIALLANALEPDVELEPLIDRKRTIESFSDSDCWNFFETRKEDLPRLQIALRIPARVTLMNGSSMSGKELMLRGLYELVSGNDQHDIAVVFGGA